MVFVSLVVTFNYSARRPLHRIDREVYCPQHTVGSTCWWYTLPALCCQAYTCFQQNYINVQWLLSQSWLDSICRDSTDTQYMTKQTLKISKILNLYFIPTYCSSSSVFIMNNTPSGAKNTKPESHLETKMFFFFLFRLASSLCAWLFLHKQQHFTLSSAPAHNFFTWSLTRWFELVTEELWLHLRRHFFTCTHVYKSLSNKTIHYSRLLN